MLAVSAFHAKTHLSELLHKVQLGEHICITKHNHPVAYLIPIQHSQRPHSDIRQSFFDFRKGKTLSNVSLMNFQSHIITHDKMIMKERILLDGAN